MKFSIITCTWNSAAYLDQAIGSVSAQDYPSIERIFVDGGSTDATLDIIARVPGDVKVLHGIRGGISRAMNEGVRVATGDIIAHLHSDDMYLGSDVLSLVADRLGKSDANWLYGRCKSLIDGRLIDNDFETKAYSWAAILRRNLVPHPATFVRRQTFLDVGGFDPRWKYAMDYDMWLKLGRLGPPVQVWDYIAAFRLHPGSLSTRDVWAAQREDLRVRLSHTGRNPLEIAEHLARFGVRWLRFARQPPPYAGAAEPQK